MKKETSEVPSWELRIRKLIKGYVGHNELVDFISQTIISERKSAMENMLKFIDEHYLLYCAEQNSLPYCKNCGLDRDELEKFIN